MRKFFKTNFLITGLLILFCFSWMGCFSGDSGDDGSWYTDLALGTSRSDSISAYGSNVYRVYFSTTGSYTMKLTHQESDCGMTFCTYDPNDSSINDLTDNIVNEVNVNSDTLNEVAALNVTSTGYIYVVVDEWDNVASSYTITLLSGAPTKSADKILDLNLRQPDSKKVDDNSLFKDIVEKWRSSIE